MIPVHDLEDLIESSGPFCFWIRDLRHGTGSPAAMWQVLELICFRVRDLRQLSSPGVWTTGSNNCIIPILTRKQKCFRVRDLRQLESRRSVDHRKLYSADYCGISRFDRPTCMACFRIGQSRKQGMQDIHMRKQKFAGKSVPETTT